MIIKPINYVAGGISIELVAETVFETALLAEAWRNGKMKTGNGDSPSVREGGQQGFYIEVCNARI